MIVYKVHGRFLKKFDIYLTEEFFHTDCYIRLVLFLQKAYIQLRQKEREKLFSFAFSLRERKIWFSLEEKEGMLHLHS